MEKYKRLTNKDWKEHYDLFEEVCCDTCTEDCGKCKLNFNALKRLAELEDKIEKGKLVELPCGIGDTVYSIAYHYNDDWFINVGEVRSLSIEKNVNLMYVEYENEFSHWYTPHCYNTNEIGVIVFFTKKEAEARLAELKEAK